MNNRQLATVLAALRMFQDKQVEARGYGDIATDGGKFKPLTYDEIDALCEELNGTGGACNAEHDRAALRAIVARIDGIYDDPALLNFGALSLRVDDDVKAIAAAALSRAGSIARGRKNT